MIANCVWISLEYSGICYNQRMGRFLEDIEKERRLTELLAPVVMSFPYDPYEIRSSNNNHREHYGEQESITKLHKLCKLAMSAGTVPSCLILFWLMVK
jgi:hypothetical protein